MKKILSTIIIAITFISLLGYNVNASYNNEAIKEEYLISESTEYFADGTSIITTITKQKNNLQICADTKTITGSKTSTYKDKDGNVIFKFKVTATFYVTIGVNATCTSVNCSASDLANGWTLDSYSTSKSKNEATAKGVFKHKTLFITDSTKEVINTLSCTSNGELK